MQEQIPIQSNTPSPTRPAVPHSVLTDELKHLAPGAVWLFFVQTFAGFIFLFIFMGGWVLIPLLNAFSGAGASFGRLGSISGIFMLIVAALISWAWAKLSYNNYKYQLTPKGFRKEQGVIFKKYVTIPYSKIQNVDIYRGIMARILGLSDLNIQTAGASAVMHKSLFNSGMGAEGRLLGLTVQDAEFMRDQLVELSEKYHTQGL